MSFIVHPSNWEVEHAGAIFRGQAYQATHDGQLPDTPMWRMLEFRHSLNAARFDHWHPNVGLILERGGAAPEAVSLSRSDAQGWTGRMRGPGEPFQSVVPESLTNPIMPAEVWNWRGIAQAPPHAAFQSVPEQPALQSVPEPSAAVQGLTALALTVAVMVKRHRLRRLMGLGDRAGGRR